MSVSMTCLWTLSYRSPMRLCAAGELFMHLVFLIKREKERGRERMEGKMCQSQYKKDLLPIKCTIRAVSGCAMTGGHGVTACTVGSFCKKSHRRASPWPADLERCVTTCHSQIMGGLYAELSYSWNVGVWAVNTGVYPGAWPRPSPGTADLGGVHVKARWLGTQRGPGNSYCCSHVPVWQLLLRSHVPRCGSSMCPYLLALVFVPCQPWGFIVLGLAEGKGWSSQRVYQERRRTYSLAFLCWNWSFSCHLQIMHLSRCCPLRDVKKILLCTSQLLRVVVVPAQSRGKT